MENKIALIVPIVQIRFKMFEMIKYDFQSVLGNLRLASTEQAVLISVAFTLSKIRTFKNLNRLISH